MTVTRSSFRTGTALGIALLVAGAFFVTFPRDAERLSLQSALNKTTIEVLDETLATDLKTFLIISAVKSGMALIEGTRVGVGFDVEVGDVIQPAYDYIDFIWEVFLYALVVLGFYKILMETGFLSIGIPIPGAGLITLGLSHLGAYSRIRILARRMVLVGILLSYLVR
jgi:hypothetical protein